MITVSRKAKQKHPLDFFMMVWFHMIKISLYLRLITNNYNVIGHHLVQNVRRLLCYQLINSISSEHVFYLLLFALYYFCIILITYFSSESDPGIIGTPHQFRMQYSIYQIFFFFPYCQLCKQSPDLANWINFFPCIHISHICLQMWWNAPIC